MNIYQFSTMKMPNVVASVGGGESPYWDGFWRASKTLGSTTPFTEEENYVLTLNFPLVNIGNSEGSKK